MFVVAPQIDIEDDAPLTTWDEICDLLLRGFHGVRFTESSASSDFRDYADGQLDQVPREGVDDDRGEIRQLGCQVGVHVSRRSYRRLGNQHSDGERGYRKRHEEWQVERQRLLRCGTEHPDHV